LINPTGVQLGQPSTTFFFKKKEDFQHPAWQGLFVYIIAQISYKVGRFSVKLHFQNL
jgi:hypothetical protein